MTESTARPFRCQIMPRYTDLDTWRHVNNTRAYHIHQEARMQAHMHRFGPDAWFADGLCLRPQRCLTDYRQISWYGQPLEAEVTLLGCDRQQFHLRSQLYQNGELVGIQDAFIGAYDQGRWVDLPAAIHQQLQSECSAPVSRDQLPDNDYKSLASQAHNFPVRQQLTPRYADLDADSLRSEAGLARYMEQARFGGIRQLDMQGLGILIARADISYCNFRPGWHAVELASGISRIGNTSFVFTGCALDKDEVQAAANSVMVVINPQTNRPAPIPASLREQLQAWSI
ncbi:acyl-CoA thioesterase [Halopseudomonas salegens]|uniref:Acyl-CoA thioesterase FadM n=1 Tax=Halopseudomonas salegens TaxID=1434072 RepID=A0A1H2HMZ4_9GAMM|nr:hypothetical protein [Halopseudomonas salegens]SDU33204.1 Acyl-CoA thioesterase FadM [Halopseudomonas salegens]